MNKRQASRWLHEQLPGWVESGLISAEAAEELRLHYPFDKGKTGLNPARLFLGLLGSLLIGAGIILLLAHNWQNLGRPARTILSLLPLLSAQVISCWVLWADKRGLAWRESCATFHSLSVAAAIALIAQTYHMPGAFDTFLLTWMLMSLPVVYLLNAVAPMMIYLAGIIVWAGAQQSTTGHALHFWILAVIAIPFIGHTVRHAPFSARTAFLRWAVLIAATSVVGILMENSIPALWIPLYTLLFGGFFLAGGISKEHRAQSGWIVPERHFGALAALTLCYFLSWREIWLDVVWQDAHFRTSADTVHVASDMVSSAVILGFWGLMFWMRRATLSFFDRIIVAAVPAVGISYFCAAVGTPLIASLMMNGYLLVVAMLMVAQGVREVRLALFNLGMLILSALILARFFDSDFSFIARGLVFIALGIIFLACNWLLSRRKEAVQ